MIEPVGEISRRNALKALGVLGAGSWLAGSAAADEVGNRREVKIDLLVVGGGSGGVGAALAAARLGLKTFLVEKADGLGGTSPRGGVHCWEMGAGGTGIPFDLYLRLKRIGGAVAIYSFDRHACYYKKDKEPYRFPGALMTPDAHVHYIDSLRRYGSRGMGADEAFCRKMWHGVPFEPDALARQMLQALEETGRCRVLLGTHFDKVDHADGRIRSVTLSNGDTVSAGAYVDSTGDGLLCVAAGCEEMLGQEPRGRFDEPSAPPVAGRHVNGVSLIYRVRRRPGRPVALLPADIPQKCWWAGGFPSVSVNTYPCGDRNVNMLPTMEGAEFLRLGYEAAYAECRRRVTSHWHHLQTSYAEFRDYELHWIAPALGVRESRRIVGEYVLTEHDLLAGYANQKHSDIITIADHAMDTHGAGTGRAGCGEVKQPYGVPYRCLIPKGFKNLLIACRAASFSSLAASSCRLSRTMLALGQAAGTAAATAHRLGVSLPDVPPEALREALRRQHVQVQWPMPLELERHLVQDVLL